jgi:hypothetical protein
VGSATSGTFGTAGSWTAGTRQGSLPSYVGLTTTGKVGAFGTGVTYWYGSPLPFVLNLNDSNPHQVTIYAIDGDSAARAETITITTIGGTVLDTESISAFRKGVYDSWTITGGVVITITRTAGANAVATKILFD